MQRGGRGRGRAGAAGGRGGARAANRTRCILGVLGCNGIDDDIELRGQTFCLLHAFDGGYFDRPDRGGDDPGSEGPGLQIAR